MKKYELEGLLGHIMDVINDRYEHPDMKLEIVFDLCFQALGGSSTIGTLMPKFEKPNKKRSKKK
jgi:hypothetical protein